MNLFILSVNCIENDLTKIAAIGKITVPILVSPKCLNIFIYLEKTDFCKLSGWQQRNVQIIRLKGWTLSAVVRDLAERIEDTETPSERVNKGFPDKLLRLHCGLENANTIRFGMERSLQKCKITFCMTKLSGKPPLGGKIHFSPSCSWTNDCDGETDYNDKKKNYLLGPYLF